MSYYSAARQAGKCKGIDREENDYLYDAPNLSRGIPQPVQESSYYAIERRVRAFSVDPA